MLNAVGNVYALLLGWPRLAKLNKGLFYLSARALGLHNYAFDRVSGETLVIKTCLRGRAAPVVFDVGANEGQWLAAVLRIVPTASVHAFEPQAALAARIGQRHPDVLINKVALGDAPGTLELYDYADHPGSQHASLLSGVIDGLHHGASRATKVAVTTLDDYCSEHSVGTIDLLKLDVEGFELNALRGATRMLEGGRISAIQFEFNEMNLVGRTFFDDFANRLHDTHALHRVLPHGLMPLSRHSHWLNEQFIYQNIVALRK